MSDFQVIVIGAGPGGYVAAIKCARLGLKTAIVESRDVGGTCLNRGCIPTKSLLHSAEVYHAVTHCEGLGITTGEVSFDFAKMQAKKAEVVTKLRTGVEGLLAANKIEILRGLGVIEGQGSVRVGETVYSTDNIIIATGSTPARPPIPGLDLPDVITSDELLEETDAFDPSLVIIGGGVIGVEFASVYATLGCAVTVVEAMPRILPTLDADIAQNLNMILRKKGVKVNAGAMVKQITKTEEGLCVEFEAKGKLQTVTAGKVLVAIGRRPNTAGLFAEGVSLDMERGRIVVNDRFETSLPGVYAIGDSSSKIQLAHVASAQGIAVAEIIAGHAPSMRLDLVPSCIYTSPEIASIGMTEAEATERGIAVKCGKFMMHGNGKTIIAGGERGFIKVVSDAESGKVLGAQLMCERATDMLSEITTAIVGGMTVAQMQNVMRPHPTFNEGVTEAFEDVTGQSIHSAPPRK